MVELFELSVSEGAALIAQRQLSPVELTLALLKKIDEIEPRLEAWETVDREGALAAARERERELARGHGVLGPLFGVPIGVKDIIFTAGLRTAAGFAPYTDFVPTEDAEVVARLRKAGATILGKTVTTQFAHVDPPRTKNPWNISRTPGGSSSGSAAAVAARMAPAALGTQTGGSTLRPAAYCGCIGFKPTFGRISRYGIFPLGWSLDHVGIFTRSVRDAALLLQCTAGYDERDSGSVDRSLPPPFQPARKERQPLRLALLSDFVDRAQPAVASHLLETAKRFEREGARVIEAKLPVELPLVLATHQITMQVESATVHSRSLSAHAEHYGPRLRSYVEVGQLIPATAYLHAQRLRRQLKREVETIFESFDCLLLPTAADVAPGLETTGDATFQRPWSLFGMPSLSLPSGLSEDGLPFATQLVSASFREDTLLDAAAWCEEVLGPAPAPSPNFLR